MKTRVRYKRNKMPKSVIASCFIVLICMVVYIVRDTEGAWRLLMASFALPAFALLADYVIYLYKEIKLKKLKHFSDFIFPCIYLIIGLITVIGIILYVVS